MPTDARYDFVLRSNERLATSFFVTPSYWHRPDAQAPDIVGTAGEVWQRLYLHHALNLYCAACRQIALAVTGREEGIQAADIHTRVLLDDRAGDAQALRGWSDKAGGWRYGDAQVSLDRDGGSAFFFGSISERFLLRDPHSGASSFPAELGGGPLSWNFFDPFLGENSWAALIGPLQVAHLKAKGGPVDVNSDEVRLALSLLPACLAMQSPIGGVYARPTAAGQRQERLISNETNLTLYAGLTMLRELLLDVPALRDQLARIEALLSGLRDYFRNYLCGEVAGERRFHACGAFLDGTFSPGTMANGQPASFAADVHTWGMSILGVDEIDGLYGRGSCFRLWETVKRHTGFYPGGAIASPVRGIGFSSSPDGKPVHDVCSPEWTFGAINMCRVLAAGYEAEGPHQDIGVASRLRADEQTMLEGVAMFEVTPDTASQFRAFLYVNRVADTGFGWHALPVSSLCATAWAMLVDHRFNPFHLGGGSVAAVRDISFPVKGVQPER
jgi:hypothetical protein